MTSARFVARCSGPRFSIWLPWLTGVRLRINVVMGPVDNNGRTGYGSALAAPWPRDSWKCLGDGER